MLRDYRRVVRRAAGYEVDALPLRRLFWRPCKLAGEVHLVVRDAAQQRVRDDVWLFVDFLEHEMRVFSAVRHRGVPVEVHRGLLMLAAREVEEFAALARYLRHLVVVHEPDVVSEFEQRRRVGGAESLVARVSDDERRTLARYPDFARLVIEHYDERECAADARRELHDGLLRVSVVDVAEILHRGLRVGLCVELYPLRFELGADVARVLDDAVVDEHDAVVARNMRVRVVLRHAAVRRPARVAYSDVAGKPGGRDLFRELRYAPDGAKFGNSAVLYNRYARGVVAAVLMLGEPFENYPRRVPVADVTHNSAHV